MELGVLAISNRDLELPSGKPLRYSIHVPHPPPSVARPAPMVLVLHYAGTPTPYYGESLLAELVVPALGELQAVMVAPETLGGDWTTECNVNAIKALLSHVRSSYVINESRTLLTGYSMGAIGVWHLLRVMPGAFKAALPVAGVPSAAADRETPVLALHSRNDEVFQAEALEKFIASQKRRGCRVDVRFISGAGHYDVASFRPVLNQAIGWLQKAWNEEAP